MHMAGHRLQVASGLVYTCYVRTDVEVYEVDEVKVLQDYTQGAVAVEPRSVLVAGSTSARALDSAGVRLEAFMFPVIVPLEKAPQKERIPSKE